VADTKKCKECGTEFALRPKALHQKFCCLKCQYRCYNKKKPTITYEELQARQAPFKHKKLLPHEAAWLACAFDAEGTIGIFRQQFVLGRVAYRASALISNTNRKFLDYAASLVGEGGSRIYGMTRSRNPKHKACLRLEILGRALVGVLEEIKPYLICKVRQAEICIEFRKALLAMTVNDTNNELYDRLYQECRVLNKRGV